MTFSSLKKCFQKIVFICNRMRCKTRNIVNDVAAVLAMTNDELWQLAQSRDIKRILVRIIINS